MPRKRKKSKVQQLTREEELRMIDEFLAVIKVKRETKSAGLQALVGPVLNYDFNPEFEDRFIRAKNAVGGYRSSHGCASKYS